MSQRQVAVARSVEEKRGKTKQKTWKQLPPCLSSSGAPLINLKIRAHSCIKDEMVCSLEPHRKACEPVLSRIGTGNLVSE